LTQSVVFVTPGLIDIRAFTTFGVNAKPLTSSPIGFFGTGLKYAIAVLVRAGASPVLWIGRDRYEFSQHATQFRDREFSMVRMRRQRWNLLRASNHDLPFTTELGKNWKMWMAYRELEANTRDEGGETHVVEGTWMDVDGGHTVLQVANDEFVQAHLDRDQTFLPGGLTLREEDARLQVLDRPAKHLYYRGLRVADLEKPTLHSYNFLGALELTEDRTLKYEFLARSEVARHIATCHDEALIEEVLTAPDSRWEHGLDFDFQHEAPSDEFSAVIERRRGMVSRSALRYYSGWAMSTGRAPPAGTFTLHPRPWRASGSYAFDASDQMVLSASGTAPRPDQLMTDVVDAVNGAGDGS
jgi:hypothetical protein